MSMSDPLADFLTRIRNAQHARHEYAEVPHSKLREHVAQVLVDEGYLTKTEVANENAGHKVLRAYLKYFEGEGVIKRLDRVSKPGRRVYSKVGNIPVVNNGLGISVLSTPQGVLPDYEAKSRNVGGEVLFQIF